MGRRSIQRAWSAIEEPPSLSLDGGLWRPSEGYPPPLISITIFSDTTLPPCRS